MNVAYRVSQYLSMASVSRAFHEPWKWLAVVELLLPFTANDACEKQTA